MIRRNGMKKNKKENPLLGLLILGFFGFLIWMLFFGGVDKTIKEGTKLENKYNISQKVEKGIKTGVNTYAKAFEMIGTNVSNKSIKQKEIQNNKKQVELKEEIKQVKKPQTIDDLTGELDNF
jgi:nitrogen fixation protein FixH